MKKRKISEITKTALFVALLCASSYFVIPLPFTPIVFSLQTIMVNLISYLLPPRQAIAAIGTYLIMGLIGLPVFSGGTAGVDKLFGPTGGFYFGFLFSVIAVSLLLRKKHTLFRFGLASIFVGIPIQHIAAILFMCFYNNFNPVAAALTVSVPFLVGDVIKCIVSVLIAKAFGRYTAQQ